MTELGHGLRLYLADSLPGQVEVLAHLFQGPWLPTIETETQPQNRRHAVIERREQASDLVDEQRLGRRLEWRCGTGVSDDIAEVRVPVFVQRVGQRQGLGPPPEHIGEGLECQFRLRRQLASMVGLRRSFDSSCPWAFCTEPSRSPAWTGRRMVRLVLAMPRATACRIHHVA